MKSFILSAIISLAKRYATKALWDEIVKLVVMQLSSPLSGKEKKDAVLAQLKVLSNVSNTNLNNIKSWVISMLVDVAVVQVKAKIGA